MFLLHSSVENFCSGCNVLGFMDQHCVKLREDRLSSQKWTLIPHEYLLAQVSAAVCPIDLNETLHRQKPLYQEVLIQHQSLLFAQTIPSLFSTSAVTINTDVKSDACDLGLDLVVHTSKCLSLIDLNLCLGVLLNWGEAVNRAVGRTISLMSLTSRIYFLTLPLTVWVS